MREENEFSAFDCTADGGCMLLGDKDGDVEVADAREAAKGTSINLHDRKINTLHVRPVMLFFMTRLMLVAAWQ